MDKATPGRMKYIPTVPHSRLYQPLAAFTMHQSCIQVLVPTAERSRKCSHLVVYQRPSPSCHHSSRPCCRTKVSLNSMTPTVHRPQSVSKTPSTIPLILFNNSPTLKGFPTTSSMPACIAVSTCCCLTFAVTPITGTRPINKPSFSSSRILATAVRPFMIGISQSIKISDSSMGALASVGTSRRDAVSLRRGTCIEGRRDVERAVYASWFQRVVLGRKSSDSRPWFATLTMQPRLRSCLASTF